MKTDVKKFYSEIQFNTGEEKIVQTVGDIHASDVIPSKTLQTLVDKDLRSGNISLYYDENYDSPEIPIQDQNNIDTLRSRGVTISINNY